MTKCFFFILCQITSFGMILCQQGLEERKIRFPDVDNYVTLKCDFHIHTVFSDGSVWPNIRVEEAVRDGLDAISLTEHIEYQPHDEDIPHPDRNRSYILAQEYAKPYDLIVIHGAEVTKDMPPGHANAIFITDANLINFEDPIAAYQAAADQGAFIFWNHPNWIQQQDDGMPVISALHDTLINKGLLHGIEVVNDITYSERALELAKSHDLTAIGTSDIHGLVDWQYGLAEGGHRPISLVLAKERSDSAIKEAMFAGRTIAWFNDVLIGKEENVIPLVQSCLSLKSRDFIGPSTVEEVVITNHSSAKFILKNMSDYDFYNHSDIVTIDPHSDVLIQVLTKDGLTIRAIEMEVLNAVIGEKRHPVVEYRVLR